MANKCLVYTLLGDRSLHFTLRDNNCDVWTFDLRGRDKDSSLSSSQNWFLSDYIFEDSLCAIEYIVAVTCSSKIHFIGHSMGEYFI